MVSIYRLQPVFLWVTECQKRYYNILNLVYSVTLWARYGKLAGARPFYIGVFGTAKFSGMGTKFSEVRSIYTVKITRAVPKNSDSPTKILAIPCPKC